MIYQQGVSPSEIGFFTVDLQNGVPIFDKYADAPLIDGCKMIELKNNNYTRRAFLGRGPLCGTGVLS